MAGLCGSTRPVRAERRAAVPWRILAKVQKPCSRPAGRSNYRRRNDVEQIQWKTSRLQSSNGAPVMSGACETAAWQRFAHLYWDGNRNPADPVSPLGEANQPCEIETLPASAVPGSRSEPHNERDRPASGGLSPAPPKYLPDSLQYGGYKMLHFGFPTHPELLLLRKRTWRFSLFSSPLRNQNSRSPSL